MATKKVYAVARGRATGIFTTWAECERHVKGYEGARYKSFADVTEALAWLSGGWKSAPASKKAPASATRSAGASAKPLAAHPATGTTHHRSASSAARANDAPVDYTIYTDGSCLKNPGGPGGWAIVAKDEATGAVTEQNGGDPMTTNNRMELTAVISAVERLKEPCDIKIYTDSQYVANAFLKGWIWNWKKNGWKKSDKKPVLNPELWERLLKALSKHEYEFIWVKGHAGHPENERCDRLAVAQSEKYTKK